MVAGGDHVRDYGGRGADAEYGVEQCGSFACGVESGGCARTPCAGGHGAGAFAGTDSTVRLLCQQIQDRTVAELVVCGALRSLT